MGGSREGGRGPDPYPSPLENHVAIDLLRNSGTDPLGSNCYLKEVHTILYMSE